MKPLFNRPINYIEKKYGYLSATYSIFFPDRLFHFVEIRKHVANEMLKYKDTDDWIENTFRLQFEQINQLWNFKGELDEYKRVQYD